MTRVLDGNCEKHGNHERGLTTCGRTCSACSAVHLALRGEIRHIASSQFPVHYTGIYGEQSCSCSLSFCTTCSSYQADMCLQFICLSGGKEDMFPFPRALYIYVYCPVNCVFPGHCSELDTCGTVLFLPCSFLYNILRCVLWQFVIILRKG